MTSKILLEYLRKLFLAWKEKFVKSTLPYLVNKFLVKPFLRLSIRSITAEKTAHSIECIGKVTKKFQEGYSVIMIPSHPMARRHTLGMMYHCMKISEEISGENPHVVLATDEITFVYITIARLNRLIQRLYRIIGNLAQHIMLNRNDPNSSFRAGIDIARLLRNQSIVVMAGEGYPRHDSRKYVDIPNIVESFYTKLKNKNLLSPSTNKTNFVSELVRDIQGLIDREDKGAYRSGILSPQVVKSIKQLLLWHVPAGYTLDIDDVLDELALSWGERFGALQGIDPVLGVTVQPKHKTLILPVVFTEHGDKYLHIDVRDFFLIDNISYTEVKTSLRDMEDIHRCNIALDMLDDRQNLHIIDEICEFTGILYSLSNDIFEEYYAGKFPVQDMWEILRGKIQSPKDAIEKRQIETYQQFLKNFTFAANIATLDDDDRAILREAIKLNMSDLEQVIPSIRIRQAWTSSQETS